MDRRDLGDLGDPSKYHDPLDIRDRDPSVLLSYLRVMVTIRMVEEHLASMRREGHIGGPVHLGIGQEAVAVGVSASLRPSDMVFGAHRSHSHVLALGADIRGLMAEVLGRDTGLSRGMGGSMHLWDQPHGFYGSVPIVGGTVSLAVGAALSARLRQTDQVAVSYFGDGACEEGAVQEALNLASVLKVPILFVAENNLFSSHMHISLRQPASSVARFADAHGIPSRVVDGNDVLAVADAAHDLVARSREGEGPGFLEAVTFRWLGHVDWREDIDVGVARSGDDLAQWRRRDPVARLENALVAAGHWGEADAASLRSELSENILACWDRAVGDPWPEPSALLDRVYSAGNGNGRG